MPKEEYISNGFVNLDKNYTQDFVALEQEASQIIDQYFNKSLNLKLLDMKPELFHEYTYECQEKLLGLNFQDRFLAPHIDTIANISGMNEIWHESTMFLRAIRPSKFTIKKENIGLHRETMYTDSPVQTSKAHNIWIPLSKTTDDTAVKYYPGSHLIPDSDLTWGEDNSAYKVERGSFGHKLGMQYKPLRITGGLPKNISVKKMLPNLNQFCLFSAMTIHGAGVNNSNAIRLSLTMATIDKDSIEVNKPYTASNGKPHYQQALIKS